LAAMVDADTAYLQKEGVYEHLEKIVNRVIAEKPKDAHGLVEVLSRLVREPPSKTPQMDEKELEAQAAYVPKVRALDVVPNEEGVPTAVSAVPDFMEEAAMLQWAGVGFGELESYKVKCSLRNLAAKKAEDAFVNIRLWGKILGTDADYYVAEAKKEAADAPDDENPDLEPLGVGANAYTYFVTNDLCDEWRQLPNIKPAEIVAARLIKKIMTGNPNGKVVTHPYFAGSEEVLLRAQIARINADTLLCIKGFLKKEDDAEDILPNEDYVTPPASELAKAEMWTHKEPHLLQIGRCSHRGPEDPPDEDDTENPDLPALKKMWADRLADPPPPVLRTLAEDGLEWVIKQVGDTALYKLPAKADADGVLTVPPPRSDAVTVVRSLSWPGATTVAQGKNFVNIYVGYGLPADGSDFFPSMLPDVQDEPEDMPEQEEPQGNPESEEPAEEAA